MKFVIVLLLVGIVTVSCLPKRGRGGGGRGRGRGKGPCKNNGGIELCICTDESTCDSKEDCRENCGKRSDNPILSCTCEDGETWTKPERSRNRVRPCGSWRNTESCTCNGETYEGRREKKSCKDEVEYCTCDDGTTWEPEEEDAEEF